MENNDIEINVEKRGRGRPKKYEEGWEQHYKIENYNLQYYHQNKQKIECPICKKLTNKLKLREHQRSQKCMKCVSTII